MSEEELTRQEKAKIAKREYMREYMKRCREKRKEYAERYWVKRYDRTHEEAGEHDDR